MIFFGLVGAFLTFALAGVGTALLVARGRTQVNAWEIGSIGCFFGTGMVSLSLWVGGLFLAGWMLMAVVSAVALALGAWGFNAVYRGRMCLSFPRPRTAVEWILSAVLAGECVLFSFLCFRRGLGWDGLLNWEIKARYAFLNGGVLPREYLADGAREFTHQGYPLYLPFSELWVYLWMGQPHQFWLKTLPSFWVAGGAVLLALLATRVSGQRWIGLATAILFFFVPALSSMEGGAYSGYADVPLGFLYLGAMGFLLLQIEGRERANWRMFALFLALLPWVKREGIILWAVGAACGLLVLLRSKAPRCGWLWLLPGPVLAVGWKIYCAGMGKGPDHEFLAFSWQTMMTNGPRVVPIFGAVLAELSDPGHWSLFWPMAALALFSLLWRAPDHRLFIIVVALALPLAVYPAAYVFSGWGDWLGHLHSSLPRLLLHLLPVGWLLVALALRPPAGSTLKPSVGRAV